MFVDPYTSAFLQENTFILGAVRPMKLSTTRTHEIEIKHFYLIYNLVFFLNKLIVSLFD